jgi:hypothetical protein
MGIGLAKTPVNGQIRASLWIILSVVFLVQVGLRVHRDNAVGRPITNWVFAQGLLWILVLCFWSYAAWRNWKPRNEV